jgi:hypothetical protein
VGAATQTDTVLLEAVAEPRLGDAAVELHVADQALELDGVVVVESPSETGHQPAQQHRGGITGRFGR